MDAIYPRFAAAHPIFYDEPRRRAAPDEPAYAPEGALDWTAWTHRDDGTWSFWAPPGVTLPEQGWKVHVSSAEQGAREVLARVSAACFDGRWAFKHLPHPEALRRMSAKDADRTASGKFITVYPVDEDDLREAVVALDRAVGGMPGPYVLTDVRWGAGPVSVRYGAFRSRTLRRHGFDVPAVRDPRTGELVEDVREPAFTPPSWVSVPEFLGPHVARLRETAPPPGFPTVTRALHHSNAGGVYEADDEGAPVVVKEARPFVGHTPDGRDAVQRLRDEEEVLRAVPSAGLARVRRSFSAHGHRFLVLDRVDGMALQKEVVARNPRVRADATDADRAAYAQWAMRVLARLRAVVADLHDAGYSHGDLHPGNVMVSESGDVVLLDLEMARPLAADAAPVVGAPGFAPADGRGGAAHDLYALACVEVFVFVPLTPLLALDPRKAVDLVQLAQREFALPAAWAADVLAHLAPETDTGRGEAEASEAALVALRDGTEGALDRVIAAVGARLVADADPSRHDRLWPGDPLQFSRAPFSLAHGSAGVISALQSAGTAIPPNLWAWTDRALAASDDAAPGLLDGLAGAVGVLRRAGRHAEAVAVRDRVRAREGNDLDDDLGSGLAGIGLMLLSEAEHDPALVSEAGEIARLLERRAAAREIAPPGTVATGSAGLLSGGAGGALFALRLFERTGDPADLRLAERLLEDDLVALVPAPDGSLQIDEGWRSMPYLATGSAGIGVVLADLLPYSPERARYRDLLDGLVRTAMTGFAIQSGLFHGRAGLLLFLLHVRDQVDDVAAVDRAVAHHVGELAVHGLRRPIGPSFPGDGLLRASCDLATGSAGVLAVLAAYRGQRNGESDPLAAVLPGIPPRRGRDTMLPSSAGAWAMTGGR